EAKGHDNQEYNLFPQTCANAKCLFAQRHFRYLSPVRKLSTLVKKIRPANRHAETNWGKSVGKEIITMAGRRRKSKTRF
ncbi:MAG TPA: hypothetical protein VF480_05740, partial [Verrucomicrobiae bacterium]